MKALLSLCALWSLLPAASSNVIQSYDATDFNVHRGRHIRRGNVFEVRDAEHFSDFKIRSASENIGTIYLAGTVDPDVTLSVSAGAKLPGGVTATGAIKVSCESCSTTGTGLVTTNGVEFDDSAFKNPFTAAKNFFSDPGKMIKDSFDVEMDFDLSNFRGHFEFDIDFTETGVYDISIPLPDTPVGGKFPNPPLPAPAPSATIGLVPTLDIIFAVSGGVSSTMGFEFDFPENANFKIDPIKGDLIQTNFGDVQFTSLPFKVKSGSGSVSVSLRLGAKLAFDFSAFGIGYTLESGIYFDVPTYSTSITLDPEASCELELTEVLAVDAGVYASAAASLKDVNVAVGPRSVTTFATLSLPGACLVSSTPAPSTTAAPYAIQNTTKTATRETIPPIIAIVIALAEIAKAENALSTHVPSTHVPSSLATPVTGSFITGTPVPTS